MRKQILAPVTAGVLLALAGSAQAATKSAAFQVTANVLENCTISAGNIDFGDWTGDTDVARQSNITVNCTSGTDFVVSLGGGITSGNPGDRQMANALSAVNLRYNLYTDAGHNTIWGNGTAGVTVPGTGVGMATDVILPVYGWLEAVANPGGFEAGSYSDTVTATIVY